MPALTAAIKQLSKNSHDFQAAAKRASQLLKSLSHPDRVMLLCQLTQGEFCVSELAKAVGIKQPTLSQQLGVLRREGVVSTRREGKQIYYSLKDNQVRDILALLLVDE